MDELFIDNFHLIKAEQNQNRSEGMLIPLSLIRLSCLVKSQLL